jgi:hypothetical protein
MSKWIDHEKGPECFCSMPTGVIVHEDGTADLLCIMHTYEAGAMFPLPAERPDNWPDLSREELNALMIKGAEEADARDEE